MAYGVVYKINNKTNGMIYVGQTIQALNSRIIQHKYGNLYLDRAIQKHGWENFTVEVLEECDTQEQLNEREIFWIAHFNCMVPKGYNRTSGGEGLPSFSHTAETCEKIRIAQQGENNSFFGRHHTKETRDEMSVNRKGRKLTPEQVAKIAAGNRGKKRSEESKKKMSKVHKGKPLSLEHCAKISAANTGKRRTPEHCAKISAGLMGHEVSDERRINISVAKRGKTLFKNLSDTMTEQKISYRALAKLIGVSHSIISMKMAGKRNFTAKDIEKLAEIFGLPAEYLMECAEN